MLLSKMRKAENLVGETFDVTRCSVAICPKARKIYAGNGHLCVQLGRIMRPDLDLEQANKMCTLPKVSM